MDTISWEICKSYHSSLYLTNLIRRLHSLTDRIKSTTYWSLESSNQTDNGRLHHNEYLTDNTDQWLISLAEHTLTHLQACQLVRRLVPCCTVSWEAGHCSWSAAFARASSSLCAATHVSPPPSVYTATDTVTATQSITGYMLRSQQEGKWSPHTIPASDSALECNHAQTYPSFWQ